MGWISRQQQERDHNGLRNVCCTCGHDARPDDPLVLTDTGMRVHHSDTTDPDSGLYGRQQR